MDIHKKVELQRAMGKPAEKAPCRICKLIRVYLLFAIPTLALFWLGVDFGVGDIDTQDLIVKLCFSCFSFQLFEEYIWIFSKSD